MNLLSFDAVTRFCSVAVMRDGSPTCERTWLAGRDHATQLPPAIEDCMDASDMAFADLDAIVIGAGPGSYTGIRVAMAVAKGISNASGCRVLGISSLEHAAFAHAAWAGPICPAIAAGSDRVGLALFHGPWDEWRRIREDRACSTAEAIDLPVGTLVCGPDAHLLGDSFPHPPPAMEVQRAAVLLQLALSTRRLEGPPQLLEPNYLRASTPEERLVATG